MLVQSLTVRASYVSSSSPLACPRCQKSVRAGARYCFRCGQPIVWRPRRRSGPWIIIPVLAFCAFGGVFSSIQRAARRQAFQPLAALPSIPSPTFATPTAGEQHIPPQAWPAIQCDVVVSNDIPGQLSVRVYNGSSWTVRGMTVELQSWNDVRMTSRQTYKMIDRAGIKPLASGTLYPAAPIHPRSLLRWSSRIIDITGTPQ